jgi:hypothetical protein
MNFIEITFVKDIQKETSIKDLMGWKLMTLSILIIIISQKYLAKLK